MKNIEDIIVKESTSILEVLQIIDKSSKQLAIVVDDNKRLLGTISDGDIRRALLNNISLNESVKDIYFKTPTVANINNSKEEIINICRVKKIHQIPIVDDNGNLIGIEILDELIKPKDKTNKVILMVGGLGTRLRPLTETTPKPMLKVGNKPILQTIVEKFAEYGYTNIIMCVNYKSHIIQDYFKDGSDFGVNIEYILENQRMGTAGALSLLKEKPNEPFFVMNGDLLTNVNFEHLHNYHIATNSIGTMCVREYDFQVPYGVVNIKDSKIASIEEKPTHKFFVSAGIYMLSSEVLNYIPENQFYDMPTLFEKIISEGKNAISFPLREYWLDIGRMEEYKKANDEYSEIF
ncbi:nucleotidyltransferase family protein [Aliarcobacter butzleri]|uniref:nucleotidyltransferase family protein n=1 Tax=Aliarcobacter butzleri TaxID=28197 RepID=UPI0021B3E00E|nr:nucleotidyltransferase family protein [Aliarcobacter butzleri]MCT7614602.1 nucleotidyltransferase family protein [Aliarcobacter butzleri]MCT7646443.1 nucleotidyltransferase family protein [Aliarcobacter butzleri]MDK2081716.1 nucleotidyltransferase family protein [Aliarcobacter butzleri]